MKRYILGIDEGTTSLRSVLYDVDTNKIVDACGKNFKQFYPHPAWVEQDGEEICKKVIQTSKEVLKKNNVQKDELLGIGITNQRETVVAWDRKTGKPVYHAIVWQCRRTSNMIKNLSQESKKKIKHKTGLIPNSYFSASKMKWILDNVKDARALARKGELCFGTIDSYLAFMLTGNHVTDTTNASRTMLMNIHTETWDDELLSMFKIPRESLPKILPCDAEFGYCKKLHAPVRAMIGDQQSSMIGQGAVSHGNTKITYGTGGFILTNIGTECNKSCPTLLTTIANTLGGKTEYAIEGSIFSACSAINWLGGSLGQFDDVSKTAKMAQSLAGNDGVYLVPAFTGLGAPYWKDDARACVVGMTFATKKEHLVRSALESMAYNTKALVDEMKKHGQVLKEISVDGGGSKNEFLLQFLADMLNHKIIKSSQSEATVMGAIYTAMLSLKLIKKSDIKKLTQSDIIFTPHMSESERTKNYDGWQRAVKKL